MDFKEFFDWYIRAIAQAIAERLHKDHPELFQPKQNDWFSMDMSSNPWKAENTEGKKYESFDEGKTWKEINQ